MPAYSEALDRALEWAAAAHRHQRRKGKDVPYIVHPVHVAFLLLKYGCEEDLVVAGLLHDVVEDTDASIGDVDRAFGPAVARLVAAVTEDKDLGKSEGEPKRSWRARKERQLAAILRSQPDVVALKAADALHNCESLVRDLAAQGPSLWARFNAPRDQQLWYFRSVAAAVARVLGETPLSCDLRDTVDRLAAAAEVPAPKA
jgi:(p)ppGpp synthase/HD superfamily hydrolase